MEAQVRSFGMMNGLMIGMKEMNNGVETRMGQMLMLKLLRLTMMVMAALITLTMTVQSCVFAHLGSHMLSSTRIGRNLCQGGCTAVAEFEEGARALEILAFFGFVVPCSLPEPSPSRSLVERFRFRINMRGLRFRGSRLTLRLMLCQISKTQGLPACSFLSEKASCGMTEVEP